MYEIKDTMGGIEIRLPAAEGQRRFAEVVLADGEGGSGVAWYDTEGMVVDAFNHIRPVERLDGASGDRIEEFLRSKGIELVARSDGGSPLRVGLGRGTIELRDAELGTTVADIAFPVLGPMRVRILREPDGTEHHPLSAPGATSMTWSAVSFFLAAQGYIVEAVPAWPGLDADPEDERPSGPRM